VEFFNIRAISLEDNVCKTGVFFLYKSAGRPFGLLPKIASVSIDVGMTSFNENMRKPGDTQEANICVFSCIPNTI
jgi:hypothetical protein